MLPIQVAVDLTCRSSIMLSVERANKNLLLSQNAIWKDFELINLKKIFD